MALRPYVSIRLDLLCWTVASSLLFAASVATARPFTGALSVTYMDPDMTVAGAGAGASTDGANGDFDLAAGAFAISGSVDAPPEFPPAIVRLDVSATNLAGSFSDGAGSMALAGELVHCFFNTLPGCEIPIPLGPVGFGGSDPFAATPIGTPVSGTITGGGWTTGAILVQGSSLSLAASGFDARGPDGVGAIRLVAPFEVELDFETSGQSPVVVPGFAQLDLVFAPEPRTALPLLVALAVIAARRHA